SAFHAAPRSRNDSRDNSRAERDAQRDPPADCRTGRAAGKAWRDPPEAGRWGRRAKGNDGGTKGTGGKPGSAGQIDRGQPSGGWGGDGIDQSKRPDQRAGFGEPQGVDEPAGYRSGKSAAPPGDSIHHHACGGNFSKHYSGDRSVRDRLHDVESVIAAG